MTDLIHAYDKTTGKKRVIPAVWLEIDHPQGKNFSKTPTQRKAESEGGQKDETTSSKASGSGASPTTRKA